MHQRATLLYQLKRLSLNTHHPSPILYPPFFQTRNWNVEKSEQCVNLALDHWDHAFISVLVSMVMKKSFKNPLRCQLDLYSESGWISCMHSKNSAMQLTYLQTQSDSCSFRFVLGKWLVLWMTGWFAYFSGGTFQHFNLLHTEFVLRLI